MPTLEQELAEIVQSTLYNASVRQDFANRLSQGYLTRDENPATHFCVYFLPFDQAQQKLFLVAHKKSGLWLSPGGHIDRGEVLLQTLNREIREELGIPDVFKNLPRPFLLTTVEMEMHNRSCRKHYDIWFLLPTDGHDFHVDPTEFHETRWVNKDEALVLLTDRTNIEAVNKIFP